MTKTKLAYALISALTLASACEDDASTPNTKPVAEAGEAASVAKDTELALDGSKSKDADGDTLTYKWTIKTKPNGAEATVTKETDQKPKFKANTAGAYEIELVVNDGTDASTADKVTITVTDGTQNTKPVADAGEAASVAVDTELELDGSASDDADGDELTYKWTVKTKSDGATATLTADTDEKPKFKGSAAGAYEIELIVDDGAEESAADTVTITVTAAP